MNDWVIFSEGEIDNKSENEVFLEFYIFFWFCFLIWLL